MKDNSEPWLDYNTFKFFKEFRELPWNPPYSLVQHWANIGYLTQENVNEWLLSENNSVELKFLK